MQQHTGNTLDRQSMKRKKSKMVIYLQKVTIEKYFFGFFLIADNFVINGVMVPLLTCQAKPTATPTALENQYKDYCN